MADIIPNVGNYRDYSEDGYFILLDQAKAFHRVNHDYLFKTLENLGIKGDFLGHQDPILKYNQSK